ncbi:hypothetical protein BDF20DRAFT_871562 [Mycotypha africana]|uniref:uncharacterized protein n=1 Tax=Mycotypha africana TaxID=64632 RepID=UPI002301C72B|nr:uncharacterized protein BDF20DRAFT_871562 [Mycotypha africana]KAI8979771.1 hypothetical protein BDF20DRAFT_871562 [Mycotypha africana]
MAMILKAISLHLTTTTTILMIAMQEGTLLQELDQKNNKTQRKRKMLHPLRRMTKTLKRIPYRYSCDICHKKSVEFLNMSVITHSEACTDCLSQTDVEDDNHYPIQLHLESCELYCFKCGEGKPRKLTVEKDGNDVRAILDYIKAPESADDLDKRRKAEQQLYIQELRREDMTLMHYLVEKQWGRTWMLFRNREGSPLPTKITNNKLARMNGTLDPNIRLPMDKYRPSPETHGDIISEKLWGYLSKAYGVLGRAYNEDDIIAPEYARLRVYVDDFKKSIDLYP